MTLPPGEIELVNRDGIKHRARLTSITRNHRTEHQYRLLLPTMAEVGFTIWVTEKQIRRYLNTGRPIPAEEVKNE